MSLITIILLCVSVQNKGLIRNFGFALPGHILDWADWGFILHSSSYIDRFTIVTSQFFAPIQIV